MVLRFEYLYIGLPALDAEAHVNSGNVLDAAFSALMRTPADRRAWLRAEALRRLIESEQNPWRTFLLGDLVQTYLPLEDDAQREEFEEYLSREEYMAVQQYGTTWYEEGQI
ncbi:hypothetical protein BH23PLA1_BH23PLA1_20220 [soil metagenome]